MKNKETDIERKSRYDKGDFIHPYADKGDGVVIERFKAYSRNTGKYLGCSSEYYKSIEDSEKGHP